MFFQGIGSFYPSCQCFNDKSAVQEGLLEKAIYEQRPEGGEEAGHDLGSILQGEEVEDAKSLRHVPAGELQNNPQASERCSGGREWWG